MQTLDHLLVSTLPPNHLGTHWNYPSDSSSLTPSQSASQTVAHSTEASHESPPSSKQHPQAAKSRSQPKPQLEPDVQLPQRSKPNADEDADMAVPPAHTLPELMRRLTPFARRSFSARDCKRSNPLRPKRRHPYPGAEVLGVRAYRPPSTFPKSSKKPLTAFLGLALSPHSHCNIDSTTTSLRDLYRPKFSPLATPAVLMNLRNPKTDQRPI